MERVRNYSVYFVRRVWQGEEKGKEVALVELVMCLGNMIAEVVVGNIPS